jgi:hypothetical protein
MFCALCRLLEVIQGYSFVFFVVFLALVTNFLDVEVAQCNIYSTI